MEDRVREGRLRALLADLLDDYGAGRLEDRDGKLRLAGELSCDGSAWEKVSCRMVKALFYFGRLEYQQALEEVNRAMVIDFQSPVLLVMRSVINIALGRLRTSLQDIFMTDCSHGNLANILHDRKHELSNQLHRIDKTTLRVERMHESGGQPYRCIELCDKIIRCSVEEIGALKVRAVNLAIVGEFHQASMDAKQVLELLKASVLQPEEYLLLQKIAMLEDSSPSSNDILSYKYRKLRFLTENDQTSDGFYLMDESCESLFPYPISPDMMNAFFAACTSWPGSASSVSVVMFDSRADPTLAKIVSMSHQLSQRSGNMRQRVSQLVDLVCRIDYHIQVAKMQAEGATAMENEERFHFNPQNRILLCSQLHHWNAAYKAMLLKLLCDKAGILCRLISATTDFAWNELLLNDDLILIPDLLNELSISNSAELHVRGLPSTEAYLCHGAHGAPGKSPSSIDIESVADIRIRIRPSGSVECRGRLHGLQVHMQLLNPHKKRKHNDLKPAAEFHHHHVIPFVGIGRLMQQPERPTLACCIIDPSLIPLSRLLQECSSSGLPLCSCLRVALSVATVLKSLHGRAMVHGNLQTSTILCSWDETMRDIGAIKLSMFAVYRMPVIVDHLSILFAAGGPVTPPADIYALGVLLVVLLRRTYPLPSEIPVCTRKLLSHALLKSTSWTIRDTIPDAVTSFVAQCLDPEEGRRPSSSQCVDQLQELTTSLWCGIRSPPVSFPIRHSCP